MGGVVGPSPPGKIQFWLACPLQDQIASRLRQPSLPFDIQALVSGGAHHVLQGCVVRIVPSAPIVYRWAPVPLQEYSWTTVPLAVPAAATSQHFPANRGPDLSLRSTRRAWR